MNQNDTNSRLHRRAFLSLSATPLVFGLVPSSLITTPITQGENLKGPQSPEISLLGTTLITTDNFGNIIVSVDKWDPSTKQADGIADDVFVFGPTTPSGPTPARLLIEGARILYRGGNLSISAPDDGIALELSVRQGSKNENRIIDPPSAEVIDALTRSQSQSRKRLSLGSSARFRLRHGIGISHYFGGFKYKGRLDEVAEIARDGSLSVVMAAPSIGPFGVLACTDCGSQNCQSGGPGATSCTVQCGGGQGCSVTCSASCYACCSCEGGCHCCNP